MLTLLIYNQNIPTKNSHQSRYDSLAQKIDSLQILSWLAQDQKKKGRTIFEIMNALKSSQIIESAFLMADTIFLRRGKNHLVSELSKIP